MVTVEDVLRFEALRLMRRHPRLVRTYLNALLVVRRRAGLEVRRG